MQCLEEYTKRPRVDTGVDARPLRQYHPRHVARPSNLTLQECLGLSDVVVSAVPSATYKVKTEWLKDGCVCVNVASDKNFEANVRDKVSLNSEYTHYKSIKRARHRYISQPSERLRF